MILFLTDNEIVEQTNLGGNIDVERLRQCLIDAQVTRLNELLGDSLYNEIETNLSDLQEPLLTLYNEYIKPFLARQTALEYLKIGAFNVANNGIFVNSPANGEPITERMLSLAIAQMRTKADMFAERMSKYMKKNNLYNCSSDDIVKQIKPSLGGWYL